MKKTILLIAALLVLSCAVSARNVDLTLANGIEKHIGIDSIYRDFSEAYRTLNPETVSNLYTDDAAYLVPDNEVMLGRDKILGNFTVFLTV